MGDVEMGQMPSPIIAGGEWLAAGRIVQQVFVQRLTDALNDGTADLIPRRLRINNATGFMDGNVFDNPGRAQARIHFYLHKVRPKTLAHFAIGRR
jgi:hypothetical protein